MHNKPFMSTPAFMVATMVGSAAFIAYFIYSMVRNGFNSRDAALLVVWVAGLAWAVLSLMRKMRKPKERR